MSSPFRFSVLCACLALAAGCGDSPKSGSGMDKLGGDLKSAGSKMTEGAKEAGSAMGDKLSDAGSALDKMASDASVAMSKKGDELSQFLKSKMPDLEKTYDSVKGQLAAKGSSFKDTVADLTTRNETLNKALDELTAAGANAGAEVKKAAVDAFTAMSGALQSAIAKLKAG